VGAVVAVGLLIGAARAAAASDAADAVPAAGDATTDPGTCPAGAAERAARTIQSRYEHIRDIVADFEQTNRSASFAGEPLMTPEPRSGRVVFAKPGRMRWSYLSPERSVVVSDGETLWIHDVDAESITRMEVTSGYLSGAALQFLLGDGKILDTFEVEATACSDDRVELRLLPREEATYERLGLVADPNTGDVVGTLVVDLFGNRTDIRFSAIRVNQDPAPTTFELEIPAGVEVIDYAGAPKN
jgi:outer membrane lipoprotein carrier protein